MTSNKDQLRAECQQALGKCKIPPAGKLVDYMALLLEINSRVNLTGASTPDELAVKHIADVWEATQRLERPSTEIYDVGSGGGIPGIVLAILFPEARISLVERRQKKAGALSEMVAALGLGNRVRVLCRSFEELKPLPKNAEFWFRGFLPGLKLGTYLSEWFPSADLGTLVLMKGPAWPQEKADLIGVKKLKPAWKERVATAAEIPYQLPGGAGERILVIV